MAGILKVDRIQSDSNLAFSIAGSNVAFMNATSLQMTSSNISLAGTNVITNGKVVSSSMPVGSVVQVVSANTQTTTSTSSTSFVATNLAATITPISASNKILILVAGGVIRAGSGNQIYMTVYRGATNLGNANRGLSQMNGNASNDYTPSFSYYDGPATTSSTTYTVYVATASSTVGFELDTIPCTMTLMEIAA